jgi:prepilin-type processing-associated H-X9-DG protein
LSPFIESQVTYDHLMRLQMDGAPGNGAYNAQNVITHAPGARLPEFRPGYMRCPSSPLPETETPTGPVILPVYVGIAGGCDLDPAAPEYQDLPLPDSRFIPSWATSFRNRQKGVGHVPGGVITASGMLPPCQYLRFADCIDGTSNTMVVGEQSDWLRDADRTISARYHGDPGWDTDGTGPPAPSTTSGGGFLSGTVQSRPLPAITAAPPEGGPVKYDCYNITTVRYPADFKHVLGTGALPGCSEDHGINNPLQSAHPGGLQVAFADGSVHFIAGTIELDVLLTIAIRRDMQQVRLYD